MNRQTFACMLLEARQHGRAALQALAEQHLPLVASLVRRFPPGLYEPEELYQQGCIGLMKALLRFRPEMGTAFATYAVPLILGEMRQLSRMCAPLHVPRPEAELRSRIRNAALALSGSLGREATVQEIAEALRMPPAELMLHMEETSVSSCDAPGPEGTPLAESIADPGDWITAVELRDILAQLPSTDRALLSLRHAEGLSQAETGRRLGLTQVQVSRREKVLHRQLRNAWYST